MLITPEILKKFESRAKTEIVNDLAPHLTQALIDGKINTANRVAHFLAQASHESAGFTTLHELWGPTAAQERYEGSKSLGNTEKGDGHRFLGRGIFQITGRYNYRVIGKDIGFDLISNPELAETGEVAAKSAVWFWNNRKLSPLADDDNIRAITKKINGGYNGLEDRIQRLTKAHRIVPEIMSGTLPSTPQPQTNNDNAAVKPTLVLVRKGETSDSVKLIQVALNHKGYTLSVDGNLGPITEKAIKDFQKKNKLKADGLVNIDTYNAILKG